MADPPSAILGNVSTVPEQDHNKVASSDRASACSDICAKDNQLTNEPSPSKSHTALPISENRPAVPPPPAKICKPGAARTAAPVKDFIYKVPPPLPDDHPSKAAARNRSRRCSPRARCMICTCSLVFAAILLLAIAILLFYLITQPRLPKYDIESLIISKLEFTNRTSKAEATGGAVTEYVSAAMAMTVSVRNPNKKMRVHYGGMQAIVQYEGVMISEGSMEASKNQSARNTTMMQVVLHAESVRMEGEVAGSLKESLPSLSLQVDLHTDVALGLGSWTIWSHISLHVGCSVHVTFPTTSAFSKSCGLKKVASKRIPFLLLFPSK